MQVDFTAALNSSNSAQDAVVIWLQSRGFTVDDMRQLANAVIMRRIRPRSFRATIGWTPLLTPMLRWGGTRMRSWVDDGKPWYRTYSGAGRVFSAEPLETQMIDALAAVQFSPDAINGIRQLAALRHTDTAHADVRQRIAECEAWQTAMLQQWKRGRITEADYQREWDEAQDEINKGRTQINDTTSVDQLLAALTDLGAAIRMMEPLKRKTNLARLFQIIEVDDAGKICAVVPQTWATEAFKTLVASTCHGLGRVGLEPVSCQVIEWAKVGIMA